MEGSVDRRPPAWFWIASGLALVWMLIGVVAWIMDLTMEDADLAALGEGQRQLYAMRPQWVFVVYAIATFSGLMGAIGLLLRKGWAVLALALSLGAVAIQFGYTFIVMDAIRLLGAAAAVPLPLFIAVVGLLLLWFSRSARRAAWLED